MNAEILQLGAVAVIFIFAIKEFFGYLKSRKENKNSFNGAAKDILKEIQSLNENHLQSIYNAVKEGNRDLIETIHSDNIKIIEILGRIEGRLNK